IFGPKLEAPPADIALPVARGAGYAVSGLHSGAATDHTDWYSIGSNGCLEVFFSINDGESVATAVIYARTDRRFVPLKTEADCSKRLAWDKTKLDEISKWLDEHLPIDLG